GHMRKLTLCFLAPLLLTSFSPAQQRVEVGVFLDSLSISQTSTNNFGLGVRFGYRIHPSIMLEGELAYDYGLNLDATFRYITNGDVTAIPHTSVGVTHR